MNERNLAMTLARAELRPPTVGVTAQFFEVHTVLVDDAGQPSVAHVDETRETGAYFVYFRVRDVPYYFVVIVKSDAVGQMAVSGRYVEARARAYLRISSSALSPAEITARVGLEATETHVIGSPFNSRLPTRTYRKHVWILEPNADVPGSVEQKLAAVLASVGPAAARVAALKPACDLQVNIVFEAWGGDPQFGGIHVDADKVLSLAALGVELDFDLYALGPKMLDDEETRQARDEESKEQR